VQLRQLFYEAVSQWIVFIKCSKSNILHVWETLHMLELWSSWALSLKIPSLFNCSMSNIHELLINLVKCLFELHNEGEWNLPRCRGIAGEFYASFFSNHLAISKDYDSAQSKASFIESPCLVCTEGDGKRNLYYSWQWSRGTTWVHLLLACYKYQLNGAFFFDKHIADKSDSRRAIPWRTDHIGSTK